VPSNGSGPPYYDVNNDNVVNVADAFAVISFLPSVELACRGETSRSARRRACRGCNVAVGCIATLGG